MFCLWCSSAIGVTAQDVSLVGDGRLQSGPWISSGSPRGSAILARNTMALYP